MARTIDEDRDTHIYTLIDPRSEEIRYVGKTVETLRRRLTGHITKSKKLKTHRDKWICKLIREGVKPSINLIETVPWKDSQAKESYWISQYDNLTNHTSGGEGTLGRIVSDESKRKVSTTLRNNAKIVYQYTKQGELIQSFNSCIDAAESINGACCNIAAVANRQPSKKSYKGFIWSYNDPSSFNLDNYKPSYNRGWENLTSYGKSQSFGRSQA